MLQSIRDGSKSWAAKIIIGVMVAAMALFGVESLFGVFGDDPDEAAKVNGETITRQQVELEVQRTMRSGQVPPEQEKALRRDMLDQLITQKLLTQYAEDGQFRVSEDQLDQLIVSLDEFKDQDGNFSAELFRNRLSSAGYTPLAFRNELRTDIMRRQLQQGLALSDFTLASEQKRLAELQRQTRSFRYAVLTPENTALDSDLSSEEVNAYYEANTERFKRPEQVRVNYIVLDRQDMADEAEVSEDKLRQAWREQSDNADRRISHIMIGFGDERSQEEAKAIADKALDDLNDGESFADTAARYSDDTASAENGGDLGEISRGFFGEAFDEAAFSLSQGDVSEPVEMDNALHIIKVTRINRPPFEEQREKLRQMIANRQVEGDFNERAQRLIDESFAAEDLQGVAKDIGATVEQSDWLARDGGEGVLSEPGVMDKAFSDDVLEEGYNSDVIELDEDRRLVLRVAEHREATTLPLDEVRGEVEQLLQARQQEKALTERARALIEKLEAGEGVDLAWQQADGVSRQADASVSREIVDAAFRMPKPEEGQSVYGQVSTADGVAVVSLEGVSQGEPNAEVEGFVSQMTEQLRAQAAIQGLIDYLHEEGSIETDSQ
ncbi:MAG: SurA N-terminal domain-containing protein [Halomonas sp.]|nr:SurA N-terminal domain-containing protein [Halomonas sp.]MDN6297848.1 SurA N-terminal domain-containing protein [Halomonas sp.]MDN6315155.1 SurA N-terminal domain-containing protein [Halomonas sp.]MDN6336497.1 SurA N-terminal domain-containing protein [Halomonas sp.]